MSKFVSKDASQLFSILFYICVFLVATYCRNVKHNKSSLKSIKSKKNENNDQKIYFSNIEEKRSKKQTQRQKYEKKAQFRKLGESNEK